MRLKLRQWVLLGWVLGWAALGLAQASEVKLLSGQELRGELLQFNGQELRLRDESGEEQTVRIDDVLSVGLRTSGRPLPDALPRIRVLLVDGTSLTCQGMGLRGNRADLRLFTGRRIEVPLSQVLGVLCDAQDLAQQTDFQSLLAARPRTDVVRLASRDGTTVNSFEGVLGEADADGQTIRFTPDGGESAQLSLARVRALWFARPQNQLAPVIGKAIDLHHNVFALATLEMANDRFLLKTPTGLALDLPADSIHQFDLSMGKQAWLSDLEPVLVEQTAAVADLWRRRWRRDKSLSGMTLSLGQRTYAKGLAVQARTILEYDVTGFNLFRATVGIDDQIAQGEAVVKILADGKELLHLPVQARADSVPEIELKIAGARRLRIVVDFGADLDLGAHVILAEARVLK
ncbi:MAG TPA: NPCBM/NEW2 domain-containing protein [Gemmatales bacterium]|nr:NPCBM/NEW2 domain-containing protein [Gemmatales bacterium]HMP57940.1 NPCBM/NEW2 domain-containing protein [Gemmatales bacterium]